MAFVTFLPIRCGSSDNKSHQSSHYVRLSPAKNSSLPPQPQLPRVITLHDVGADCGCCERSVEKEYHMLLLQRLLSIFQLLLHSNLLTEELDVEPVLDKFPGRCGIGISAFQTLKFSLVSITQRPASQRLTLYLLKTGAGVPTNGYSRLVF